MLQNFVSFFWFSLALFPGCLYGRAPSLHFIFNVQFILLGVLLLVSLVRKWGQCCAPRPVTETGGESLSHH